jgi:hypothetical protein
MEKPAKPVRCRQRRAAFQFAPALSSAGQLLFARHRHDIGEIQGLPERARSPSDIQLHLIESNGLQPLQLALRPARLVVGITQDCDAEGWNRRRSRRGGVCRFSGLRAQRSQANGEAERD